jgi:hypothetical protein
VLIRKRVHVYTAVTECKQDSAQHVPGETIMKVARFIIASLIAVPSAFAFAQSTPPSINDDVRASIAQQRSTYRYTDQAEHTQAAINDAKRTNLLPHQMAEMDMGRYSLSVVRPSF